MYPGDRLSLFVEPGRKPVKEIWPVHVVLDIFLACPHDLDRTVDVLGDLDGATDAIDLQPPAESAAEQMIVDDDLLQRDARSLCRRRLDARQDLAADPHFALVLANTNRAVHRLHGGVRQ